MIITIKDVVFTVSIAAFLIISNVKFFFINETTMAAKQPTAPPSTGVNNPKYIPPRTTTEIINIGKRSLSPRNISLTVTLLALGAAEGI